MNYLINYYIKINKIYKPIMTDNIKESTSLKASSEQYPELYEIQKKKVQKDSICELVLTIIFIIIFICIVLFFLFSDNFVSKQKIEPNENEKNKNQKPNKNPVKNKYKLSQSKKEDIICENGFYLPTDAKGKKKCQKCSVENCNKCYGTKKKNTCISCMESYTPIFDKKKRIKSCDKICEIGENEKCLTCHKNYCGSCNQGYKLVKGKCIINYSFKGVYKVNHKKENILLINKNYVNDTVELIIDNQNYTPSYNHTFSKKGLYNVMMLLNTENLDSAKMMFFNISHLISINFTKKFDTSYILSMKGMFKDCINLKSIELSNFETNNVRDFSYMFDNCKSLSSLDISNFNTKKATDISYMFSNCISLSSINLESFNTINIIDMSGLFYGCTSLSSIDLTNFNTKNVQYMLYMFYECSSLNSIDISSFHTENVKDISYMFKDCSSLKNINLNKFETQNVTNMEGIFMGCSNLVSLNLQNLDTKNIKNANKMFYGCIKLKDLDISSFNNILWTEGDSLFDEKVSKSGNIIITRNFYNKTKNNIPSSWKIIEAK